MSDLRFHISDVRCQISYIRYQTLIWAWVVTVAEFNMSDVVYISFYRPEFPFLVFLVKKTSC